LSWVTWLFIWTTSFLIWETRRFYAFSFSIERIDSSSSLFSSFWSSLIVISFWVERSCTCLSLFCKASSSSCLILFWISTCYSSLLLLWISTCYSSLILFYINYYYLISFCIYSVFAFSRHNCFLRDFTYFYMTFISYSIGCLFNFKDIVVTNCFSV